MWTIILKLASWALGKFFGSGDARDREREAGEELGRAKAENQNATAGLNEVQAAVGAREDAHAASDRNPDRLRDPGAPAARAYKPGPD